VPVGLGKHEFNFAYTIGKRPGQKTEGNGGKSNKEKRSTKCDRPEYVCGHHESAPRGRDCLKTAPITKRAEERQAKSAVRGFRSNSRKKEASGGGGAAGVLWNDPRKGGRS